MPSAGCMMLLVALVGALCVPGLTAAAQDQADAPAISLDRQIFACFDSGDYRRAVELIEAHLARSPNDPVMLYNLACARCRLAEHDAAAQALLRAFKAGFRDVEHLRNDPDLADLREHPSYAKILEAADRAAGQPRRSAYDQWRDRYGTDRYRYEIDAAHNLAFATALDEVSHDEMRQMLSRQAEQMMRSLFGKPPAYQVLIAVPTPQDSHEFFNGDRSVGGLYDHRLKRLVARDIGGALRHEFFHAYHYGHMERLNQPHPLWIQEGLASLYEDYDLADDGAIRFLPNDRQMIVRNRARAGRLIKWEELFNLTAGAFMNESARMYPQARSIFEFVADQGKLETWYAAYVEHFDEDRTGRKAFEIAFAAPVQEVERAWRTWVMQQPEYRMRLRPGDAALGVQTRDNASNDGVLVTDILPGSAAARARLLRGDVIVAIDGRSARTLSELRRLIAQHEAGEQIELRLRRKGEYLSVMVILGSL